MNNGVVSHKVSGSEWRKLAEFELLAGQALGDTIQARLTEVLVRLRLNDEFLNRVLKSAQEAMAHCMGAQMHRDRKIHLLIFVPGEYTSNGQSWGFFRTEKLQGQQADDRLVDIMAFYLYPEGKQLEETG